MERDNQKTHREEWTKHSDLVQDDVNRVLNEFSLEIEYANTRLAELHNSSPEEAGIYAADIIDYLNDRWGYAHDYFHICGKWDAPSLGRTDEAIIVRHSKAEAFNTVRSNGFTIKLIDEEQDDERPVIGMSFIVEGTSISTPNMQGHIEILAFAEPGDISLQYLRPGDESVVSSELSEVSNTINRVDSLLRLYTSHQDSVFFKQTAKNQEKFLRSLIEQVDAVLPAPTTYESVILHDVEVASMWVKSREDNRLCHIEAEGGEKFEITGSVVGVTMLDVAEKGFGVHYTPSNSQEIANEGLSLIIHPYDINYELPRHLNTTLVVPLASIDRLSMTLE